MLSYLNTIAGRAFGALGAPPPVPRGFRLVRKLGQGGMGVIYEAVDEGLERRVAVKRLRDGLAGNPSDRRRLLEEARLVASLRHPNIVEIYALVEHRGGLYLVFELVEGRTLDQVMAPRAGLAPELALALLRQVASALDYAHARGIVHRDLKPGNIMVAGGKVKIMDFGIARRAGQQASGRTLGTMAYMAPEQEVGPALKASDVYSLGVCLYELLAGRGPFKNVCTYFQKVECAFRPLSRAARLPDAVDDVMAVALSPFPERRHPTAAAFLADFEAALKRA